MLKNKDFEAVRMRLGSATIPTLDEMKKAREVLSRSDAEWEEMEKQFHVLTGFALFGLSTLGPGSTELVTDFIAPLEAALRHPQSEVVRRAGVTISYLIGSNDNLTALSERCLPTTLAQISSNDEEIAAMATILSEVLVEQTPTRNVFSMITDPKIAATSIAIKKQLVILLKIALDKWDTSILKPLLQDSCVHHMFDFIDDDDQRKEFAEKTFDIIKKKYPDEAERILNSEGAMEESFLTVLRMMPNTNTPDDSVIRSEEADSSDQESDSSDGESEEPEPVKESESEEESLADRVTDGVISRFREAVMSKKHFFGLVPSDFNEDKDTVVDNALAKYLSLMMTDAKFAEEELANMLGKVFMFADEPNVRRQPPMSYALRQIFHVYNLESHLNALKKFEFEPFKLKSLLSRDQFVTFFEAVLERAGERMFLEYNGCATDVGIIRSIISDWTEEITNSECTDDIGVIALQEKTVEDTPIAAKSSEPSLFQNDDLNIQDILRRIGEDAVSGITDLQKMLKNEKFPFDGQQFLFVISTVAFKCHARESDECQQAALGFIRKVCMLRSMALFSYLPELVETVIKIVESKTPSSETKEKAIKTLTMLASHLMGPKMRDIISELRSKGGVRRVCANEMTREAFTVIEEYEQDEILAALPDKVNRTFEQSCFEMSTDTVDQRLRELRRTILSGKN